MVFNFPTWAWQNGSSKKGGEKGHSAIKEVVTRDYIINIHNIHEVGFKKHTTQALRDLEICHKDENFRYVQWHKAEQRCMGPRYIPYHIPASRKHNENALVTHVPVTTFKNLKTYT